MVPIQEYEKIYAFEAQALSDCFDIINSYLPLFEQHGYTLKIGQEWGNFIKKTWSTERLPIINGYECKIYCEVQKDGDPVVINANNEYSSTNRLASIWTVSAVSRKWFKLAVDLVPIKNFVAEDIEELLASVRSLP